MAASGGFGGGSGDNCFDLDICPDLILAAIATAAAAAFYFLYIAITMAQRRRKRRDAEPNITLGEAVQNAFHLGKF